MRPIRVEPTTVECLWSPLPARSWWAVGGTLALITALAGALLSDVLWFDPAELAPLETYALSNKDSTVFALARARSPERARADVLLLGSSAARESLWDENRLSRASAARVAKLTSDAQNPVESLFLLEQQPLRKGQLVILSVGISQVENSNNGQRLVSGVFLQSPHEFAARYPAFFTHQDSWLARRRATLAGTRALLVRYLHVALPRHVAQRVYGAAPLAPLESYYTQPVPPEGWAHQRQQLKIGIATKGRDNLRRLLAAVDAIARSCARQGATLVLLESPHLHSDLQDTFGAAWLAYRDTLEALAAGHGVRYVHQSDQLALTEADFADAVHMAPRGRDAWSAQLLRELPSWRTPGI